MTKEDFIAKFERDDMEVMKNDYFWFGCCQCDSVFFFILLLFMRQVMCVVEGVDAATAMSVQARQSYKLEDIVFDHTFVPCVTRDEHGQCHIDFRKFHNTRPLQPDSGSVMSQIPSVI
eukprot:m.133197 g.133197  ORF g.133197 m.133197 type:complete len:118 (+) comp13097_c0_seq12:1268-1621(+)